MFSFIKKSFYFAGDVGFDDREIMPDSGHLDDCLYKSPHVEPEEAPEHMDHQMEDDVSHTPPIDNEKQMDIDLPPPVVGDDDFGGGFMGTFFFFTFTYLKRSYIKVFTFIFKLYLNLYIVHSSLTQKGVEGIRSFKI